MEISQKAVLLQVASNDDVSLAQARLVAADFAHIQVRPCYDDPGQGVVEPPGTKDGTAKRHHHDAPDRRLGETLATARALQGVVDDLWASAKAAVPDLETPAERRTTRAYLQGVKHGQAQEAERQDLERQAVAEVRFHYGPGIDHRSGPGVAAIQWMNHEARSRRRRFGWGRIVG